MKRIFLILLFLFVTCNKTEVEKPKENRLFQTRQEALKSFEKTRKEVVESLKKEKDLRSIEKFFTKRFYIKDHYKDEQYRYNNDLKNLAPYQINYEKLIFVLEKGDLSMVHKEPPGLIEIWYEKGKTKDYYPRVIFEVINAEWKIEAISYIPGV